MVRQLFIDGESVPITEEVRIPITKQIIDIAEPDKRKADISKQFRLPASKELRKKFGFIDQINIESTYNPNKKLDATYFVNSQTIIEGSVRLLDIEITEKAEKYFLVQLIGSISNIFKEFGDENIDDDNMNWDELDHDYTRTNQQNSWDTSYQLNGSPQVFALGSGYVYGMINYGRHTNYHEFDVEDFFPGVYAREYLVRMFAAAGFTWDSDFLDSAYFKQLVVPFNRAGEFGLSDTAVTNRKFEAETPVFNSNGLTTFTAPKSAMSGFGEKLRYTAEVSDPTNQHNTATGTWTVGETGTYDISTLIDITADFNPTGAVNDSYCNCYVQGQIFFVKNTNQSDSRNAFPNHKRRHNQYGW